MQALKKKLKRKIQTLDLIVGVRLTEQEAEEIETLSIEMARTTSFVTRCLIRCGLETLQNKYKHDKLSALLAFHLNGK